MSIWMWIAVVGFAGWGVLAALVGLLLAGVIRLRDEQVPAGDE